jgi:hypothetical protein
MLGKGEQTGGLKKDDCQNAAKQKDSTSALADCEIMFRLKKKQ